MDNSRCLLLLWLIAYPGGFVTTSLIQLLLIGAIVILAINLFSPRSKRKRMASVEGPEKRVRPQRRLKARR